MAKPATLDEVDEARRVLAMLDCVTNPDEYRKIFDIKKSDVTRMRKLLQKRKTTTKKNFYY